ncbi:excalibur calcium-binding domain-containing protein [Streptomyces sp. NPDC016469]|uniref:excalibur calcium-binding domain-containing protein n=1 Tax=Streptomyces sp. NPDC016469 TaxID=3157191 RepID=UPI0033D91907
MRAGSHPPLTTAGPRGPWRATGFTWGPPPRPSPFGPQGPGGDGWARKRTVIPAAAVLFLIGVGMGAAGGDSGADRTEAAAKSSPAPTVAATVSVTPAPEPAVTEAVNAGPKAVPTVTKTKTVKVTVAPEAPARTSDDSGSSDSGSGDSGSGDGGSGDSGSGDGGSGGGGSAYYANTAVRAAGAAPIHRSGPGYGPRLGRDGDGVACE